jgi:hydrogenase maturation protein HypF
MTEHGVPGDERVIGFAFDGTGFGADGAIWGGEVLVAGYRGFERAAHLRYVPLPGGDSAIRKPYRAALAHLWAAGLEWTPDLPPVRAASASELAGLERQLQRNAFCVPTSSMGRLFDAVSSLVGLRHIVTYEAQAAIELERLAAGVGDGAAGSGDRAHAYRFSVDGDQIDPGPVLQAIVDDWRQGCSPAAIAAGFHHAVARLIAETASGLCARTGIDSVALSGGVFQNILLMAAVRAELARCQLTVLTHRVVPPNDGGLALGQAAIVAARAAASPDGEAA